MVSFSGLLVGLGVEELDVNAGLVGGTWARGGLPCGRPRGRPRSLPRGLERVSLGCGSARVEFSGRPLGLSRGRLLDVWPLSALAR